MKFRIDIGPESLKKHFSERKSMKNHEKSPKSTAGPRHFRQFTIESLQKFGYSIFHIREKKDTPTYKKTDFPDRDKNVFTLTYARNSYV